MGTTPRFTINPTKELREAHAQLFFHLLLRPRNSGILPSCYNNRMQTQRKNTNRIEKVEALIQKEVGKILHNILDTELGLVTVSKVEASRDLRWAKVWVSIVGKDDNIVLMQCHASQQ